MNSLCWSCINTTFDIFYFRYFFLSTKIYTYLVNNLMAWQNKYA
jgi:hypothetical protein